VEDSVGLITISAVYLPPKHTVKQEKFIAEPTYWPSNRNKLPDLVDLYVTNGIPQDFAAAKSSFDLSSAPDNTNIT
jgi:hypothetical protein